METGFTRSALALVLAALAGSSISCSGGGAGAAPDGGGGNGDTGTTGGASAGTGTGTLAVSFSVVILATSGDPSGSAAAYAYVGAIDTTTQKGVTDATVMLTPMSRSPVALTSTGPGVPYQNMVPGGWAPAYGLSVTSPTAGSRTGVVLVSPAYFHIALDPVPHVGEGSMLTWSPSGEPNVTVRGSVGLWTSPATEMSDTGSFAVPGSAFKSSPLMGLGVARTRDLVAAPTFTGSVAISVSIESLTLP
jgi:hypothetical protein